MRFKSRIWLDNGLKYPSGAGTGFVLTSSDADGNAVWAPSSGGAPVVTVVTTNMSVTLATADTVLLADVTGGSIGVNLPATSYSGEIHEVKDSAGHSEANPIVVNGNGHLVDGQATFTIDTNFGSARFISDGTNWYAI